MKTHCGSQRLLMVFHILKAGTIFFYYFEFTTSKSDDNLSGAALAYMKSGVEFNIFPSPFNE